MSDNPGQIVLDYLRQNGPSRKQKIIEQTDLKLHIVNGALVGLVQLREVYYQHEKWRLIHEVNKC